MSIDFRPEIYSPLLDVVDDEVQLPEVGSLPNGRSSLPNLRKGEKRREEHEEHKNKYGNKVISTISTRARFTTPLRSATS